MLTKTASEARPKSGEAHRILATFLNSLSFDGCDIGMGTLLRFYPGKRIYKVRYFNIPLASTPYHTFPFRIHTS